MLRWQQDNLIIAVKVQPRASRVGVIGLHGEAIKIALNQPPVEGAANRALCEWLAGEFKVAKGKVTLVAGEKSRNKRVQIANVDPLNVEHFCQKWNVPKPN